MHPGTTAVSTLSQGIDGRQPHIQRRSCPPLHRQAISFGAAPFYRLCIWPSKHFSPRAQDGCRTWTPRYAADYSIRWGEQSFRRSSIGKRVSTVAAPRLSRGLITHFRILCPTRRQDTSINIAFTKYQAWIARNADAGLDVIDVSVETKLTNALPGWNPYYATLIAVKFYGRARA